MGSRMPVFPRSTRLVALAVLAGAIAFAQPILVAQKSKTAVSSKPDDKTIIHVLNRIGFGPGPGDVARVRQMGLEAYIDQQLHPDRISDAAVTTRLAAFETLDKSTRTLAQEYFLPAQMARREEMRKRAQQDPSMTTPEAARPDMRSPEQLAAARAERQVLVELNQQKILRAAYSDRQLEEVMVDFWFNHFNVFAGKGATRVYLTEYERDAIRPNALGKFRDLLHQTAESPAMLFYLDNWQSSAPEDAATMEGSRRAQARRANARRMQDRNRPGTLADLPPALQNRRPRGLNENYARELMELHTLGVDGGYTQKDVQEVARALTGWTIANPRQGGGFQFEPRLHDNGEKVVLGHKIKAGGGKSDGDQVLDILANHPSTARFISMKLARRFVSDEPPPVLVERAARRFKETGGDIREVVRTIVTSPEFFTADAYRAKVKTPFEFVVSAIRATGADAVNALPVVQTLRDLGMPLYMCQPPTGYSDKAEAWVNTGALLNRMNFAVALASGRMRGVRPAPLPQPASVASASLVSSVLGGDVSETTTATVAKATAPEQAVALVLGSPEFQKR
jgi:uncharacterized protein (DUF1800 family)